MNASTLAFLLLCALLTGADSLKLYAHLQAPSHPPAQSIDDLANLTESEDLIKAKLTLVSMQLAAVNNTLFRNIYVPYMDGDQIRIRKPESLVANESAQLCMVLNQSDARNVELYVAGIDKRLEEIRSDIANLGASSPNQKDLLSVCQSFEKRNEYLKFLLLHPCQFQTTTYNYASIPPLAPWEFSPTAELSPQTWYKNQNLNNYLIDGSVLANNTCPRETPYIVDGVCTACNTLNFLYDVRAQKCVSCPPGKFFSESGHQCLPFNSSRP